jgi:hypothetical protein
VDLVVGAILLKPDQCFEEGKALFPEIGKTDKGSRVDGNGRISRDHYP